MTATYHRLLRAEQVPQGRMFASVVHGWPVAVANGKDGLCAFIDKCSHPSARLSGGPRGSGHDPVSSARRAFRHGQRRMCGGTLRMAANLSASPDRWLDRSRRPGRKTERQVSTRTRVAERVAAGAGATVYSDWPSSIVKTAPVMASEASEQRCSTVASRDSIGCSRRRCIPAIWALPLSLANQSLAISVRM